MAQSRPPLSTLAYTFPSLAGLKGTLTKEWCLTLKLVLIPRSTGAYSRLRAPRVRVDKPKTRYREPKTRYRAPSPAYGRLRHGIGSLRHGIGRLVQLTSTSTQERERQRVTLPCCLATLLGREGRWSGMVTRKVDLVRCLSIGKALSPPAWKVSQLTSTSTAYVNVNPKRERQRVTLPCLAPLPVWDPLIFAVKCMEIQNWQSLGPHNPP